MPLTVTYETVENADPASHFSSLIQGTKDAVLILSVRKPCQRTMFRFDLIKSAFDLDKHTVTRLHVATRGLKNSQAFNCFLKSYNNQAE